MSSEDRFKGIVCDLGGAQALVSLIRRPGKVRIAALSALEELSDFGEDPGAFMLLMPGVRGVRNAMKKRVGKALLSSKVVIVVSSILSELGPDYLSVAIKLLYRLVGCLFAFQSPDRVVNYEDVLRHRAFVDLFETVPVAVLAAELQRSAHGRFNELHAQVRSLICILLETMRDLCTDVQSTDHLFIGSRVVVRDDATGWFSGTIVARKFDEWLVRRDYDPTQSRVWKFVEGIGAPSSLVQAIELLYKAGIVPALLDMLETRDAITRCLALRVLQLFSDMIASSEMRSTMIEEDCIPKLLHLRDHPKQFSCDSLDEHGLILTVLYNLCTQSIQACAVIHQAGGVPILIDWLCQSSERETETVERILDLLAFLLHGDNRARAVAFQFGMVPKLVLFIRRNCEDDNRLFLAVAAAWALAYLVFDDVPAGPVLAPGAHEPMTALIADGAICVFEQLAASSAQGDSFPDEFSKFLQGMRAFRGMQGELVSRM
ncbi:unnamed protein product [Prorocentrum cordatum]|uniref:Armadillo repeat-containing protein 8 n=1 Tax=Prorocentrum cordatum TaxID=2364126 RepID=A0ABN9RG59_9DINO|nr:unnamed protein product [Polarella glacialis]